MRTKTTTGVTHYHIQKKRRAEFIEEWRKHRRTVVRRDDVALKPTARGMRSGVYMGWDGDSPTRCLDALVHELDAGGVTTVQDRKSTRLNSSHLVISYAVFCLKKKKKKVRAQLYQSDHES